LGVSHINAYGTTRCIIPEEVIAMMSSKHADKFVFLGFVISLFAQLALSGCSQTCPEKITGDSGYISSIDGGQLQRSDGVKKKEMVPAKQCEKIGPNDTFVAGPNVKAEFTMSNKNLIRIGSQSKIQFLECLESGAKCTSAFLRNGTARFDNRSEDAPISVKTPFGKFEAAAGKAATDKAPAGCVFDLYVSDRSVELVSREGTVDFISNHTSAKNLVLKDSFIVGGDELATSTSSQITADWKEWNIGRDSKLGDDFAWVAVLACTVATIYCATEYAGCTPRIFASMAIFAMGWAVLLPYYWEAAGNELLASFQGVLLALSGGPLRRQADVYRGIERLEVRGWEKYGLWLLLLLILPHFVKLPFHSNVVLEYYPLFDKWLDALLLLLGYFSVGHGVKSLTEAQATPSDMKWWHNKEWLPLALVLFMYCGHEIAYRIDYSIRYFKFDSVTEASNILMPTYFKWAFALLKINTTALYLWLVMRTLPHHAKCAVCPELECGR
jgi:hypothetical protein